MQQTLTHTHTPLHEPPSIIGTINTMPRSMSHPWLSATSPPNEVAVFVCAHWVCAGCIYVCVSVCMCVVPAEVQLCLFSKTILDTSQHFMWVTVTADWTTVPDSQVDENVLEPETKCLRLWMGDLFGAGRRFTQHSRGRNSTAGCWHSISSLAVLLIMGGNPPHWDMGNIVICNTAERRRKCG